MSTPTKVKQNIQWGPAMSSKGMGLPKGHPLSKNHHPRPITSVSPGNLPPRGSVQPNMPMATMPGRNAAPTPKKPGMIKNGASD